jgi:predicted transport protein
MPPLWKCPRCKRSFRQINQRHSCGRGSRTLLLRGKPEGLVDLYNSLEKTLKAYGGVEIVARDRYALFRTSRIFADLVFMRDTLRLTIHLKHEVSSPIFFKVVRSNDKRVSHVARLQNASDVRTIEPYLKEAYHFSQTDRP